MMLWARRRKVRRINHATKNMIKDIDEAQAEGAIAVIYDEIRDLWGVAYVSAVHRYMASRPRLLEWAWAAVGPAFQDGRAQSAAHEVVDALEIAALDRIGRAELAACKVDQAGSVTVRAIADNFVRVAPVNMMFAALLQRVIAENLALAPRHGGIAWPRPAPLPPLPAMVAIDTMNEATRSAIMRFATDMDGSPFVPGLYRMLANWPGLLNHLAMVMPGQLASSETARIYATIRQRIDAAADGFALTRPVSDLIQPRPSDEELQQFQAIATTYRSTSPEMIVAGTMIARALT